MEPLSTPVALRVDVGDVAPPGCKELALEAIPPSRGTSEPRAVLVCFPGGGMTRGYFDLAAPGYSFAGYASARGFLVVLADHPGTGDSDPPAARGPLLAVCGHASMIPGSARPAASAADVPVFLGVGEHDIATDHRLIPNEFPASGDITLYVLPGAGHNHNVEPGREQLWERVTSWAGQLPGSRPGGRRREK